MSYQRSALLLGSKRLTVREAAALQGVKPNTLQARMASGWTRRQVLGLDPPPGVTADFDCDQIAQACRKLEREYGETLPSRALAGDVESLGKLAGQGLLAWDHCHQSLVGDPAHCAALHHRPTRGVACGCTVDAATGITVLPCAAHADESVRRARRRDIERERALQVRVNMVRDI
jgi:hypothetical protein